MMVFGKEWGFLRAAVPDLQDYLFSAQLYWPLNVEIPGQPRESSSLTPGNLMLVLRQLSSIPFSQPLEDELKMLIHKVEFIRERWQANWQKKAASEFPQRVKLWENYLRDLKTHSQKSEHEYRQAVRWRTISQLLGDEMGFNALAENEPLTILDKMLEAITVSGSFVWQAEMENGFPKEKFWFLYISLI
jgi:hypothetical protein